MIDTPEREALIKEARVWAALIGTEPRGARELFNRLADALTSFEQSRKCNPAQGEPARLAQGEQIYVNKLGKTGDPCSTCGTTYEKCDERIFNGGQGACCSTCGYTGTHGERSLGPQSEPSDEQVKAAAHALSEWLNDNAPIGESRYEGPARAALRAAAASEQGESHV